MSKIFVTGGNGFVGKALVNKLEMTYGSENILHPSSKDLDLMKYSDLEQFFLNNDIEIVFHIAARLGGVDVVMNNPLHFLEDNLVINYNIVKLSIKYGVKKFITLGSSCCYNNDIPLPMHETEFWSKKPENTYGLSKLVLLEHLTAQNVMKWVYLVPPNIYGPGDHFGEKNSHFIPATVMKFEKAVKDSLAYIDVWGDGSQTRDFVYIEDMVNILCRSLEIEEYEYKIINVATSIGVSVKEIVIYLKELMGLNEIEIRWDITKPTGTLKKVLSNELILQIEDGYEFVKIHEGLKCTVNWLQNKKMKN